MFSYDDIGEGDVLLLLHGLGNRKEAWIPQHELGKKYRLIIPDLIGHGSSPINENLTIEHAVSQIIALMNSLGIESFHLCGLSLGGLLAQEIYRTHRHRIKRLILANTCSYVPFVPTHMFISKQEQYLHKHSVADFKEHAIRSCFYSMDERKQQLANKAFSIRKETYIESSKMTLGKNYFPFLFFIRVPVLIISSTMDKITPLINSVFMHQSIFNSKLVVIPQAGHLSNIENPEQFNKEVELFLAS